MQARVLRWMVFLDVLTIAPQQVSRSSLMLQGSRLSANQNSWVILVFRDFTESGSFPSILASSPVTVLILKALASILSLAAPLDAQWRWWNQCPQGPSRGVPWWSRGGRGHVHGLLYQPGQSSRCGIWLVGCNLPKVLSWGVELGTDEPGRWWLRWPDPPGGHHSLHHLCLLLQHWGPSAPWCRGVLSASLLGDRELRHPGLLLTSCYLKVGVATMCIEAACLLLRYPGSRPLALCILSVETCWPKCCSNAATSIQ